MFDGRNKFIVSDLMTAIIDEMSLSSLSRERI